MPISGDLKTMSLYDLLDWASRTQKTGVLELERNKVCRRIEFRKGMIGACSSDDPSSRLGQFLLSRGKIDAGQLRDALARQTETRENLGRILTDTGALTQNELSRQIAAKAEETIHGLFDWQDAVFRFHSGATLDPNHIAVNLPVRNILFRGIQRADELRRIRQVFTSSGVVLKRTSKPAPENLNARDMARRILELIDGDKTIAQILLHAHALEFPVLRFLNKLLELELVQIAGERPIATELSTLLDRPQSPSPEGSGSRLTQELKATVDELEALPGASKPDPREVTESAEAAAAGTLMAEMQVASQLLAQGSYETALDLLNECYCRFPNDLGLRRLLSQAEAAFVTSVRREGLNLDLVPVLTGAAEKAKVDQLPPEQAFLVALIDGRSDIQSLLWIAPLREVDLMKSLWEMKRAGLIELRADTPTTSVEFEV